MDIPNPESIQRPLISYASEQELVKEVIGYSHDFAKLLGHTKLSMIMNEVKLSGKLFVSCNPTMQMLNKPRIDILWQHEHGFTIIEVKHPKSTSDMLQGIGQLQYYKSLFSRIGNIDKSMIECVLVADTLNSEIVSFIEDTNFPIHLVQWDGFNVAVWKNKSIN